jgi:zinc protease
MAVGGIIVSDSRKWISIAVTVSAVFLVGLQAVDHPTGVAIVVDEDASVPLVAAMIVVSSGSAVETPDTVGMSHLLEHLLFDGTTTRARKEIYDAFDGKGVLYNAFTREDFVAYFIVAPTEAFRDSFEILCDMVFQSVFPDDELAKERKVVIEELTRDNERPESRAYDRFRLFALADTPYRFPVIGYRDTVSSVTKETIYDHYRRIYRPKNMTFIFSGNLSQKDAEALVSEFVPADRDRAETVVESRYPNGSAPTYNHRITVFSEALPQARLYLALPAPPAHSPDVPAFSLLLDHLNDSSFSFQRALTASDNSPIASASFSYSAYRFAAWTEVQIELTQPEDYRVALDRVAASLSVLTPDFADAETTRKKARAARVSDLYFNESLTYRAMNVASQIGIGRTTDFLRFLREAPATVTPEQLRAVAAKYFAPFRFRGALVLPEGSALNLPEVITWAPPAPEVTEYALTGGAVLIVKRNTSAPVFAAHLLTRKRMALPAASKPGVPELAFRLLFPRSPAQGGVSLEDFGGRLKVTDDLSIPFDDYYYSRNYGYVRLEAPMDAAERALAFFLSGVFSPALSEEALRDAKKDFSRQLLSLRSRSSHLAGNALYKALFPDSLLGAAFPGDPDGLPAVTLPDILQYYSQAFRPENLIISVVSNLPAETVRRTVDAALSQKITEELPIFPPVHPPHAGADRIHIPAQGPQATIYFATPLPGFSSHDFARWQVATLVLSALVAEDIREKRGLAYSVGAGLDWGTDYSVLRISMGTSPENTAVAVSAILDLLAGLGAGPPPDDAALAKAVNQYWGRHLRYHQSAINQAYYLGYSAYLTGRFQWDLDQIDALRGVRASEVQAILRDLADPSVWRVVVAGQVNPFEGGSPSTSPSPVTSPGGA